MDRKAALLAAEGVAFDARTRRIVDAAALLRPDNFPPTAIARALAALHGAAGATAGGPALSRAKARPPPAAAAAAAPAPRVAKRARV